MAQFQVYRLGNGLRVVDLQTNLIETGTRMVAPLIPLDQGPRPLPRLEPVVVVEGVACAVHTAEMAAVPTNALRLPLADLSALEDELRRALDMVFSGF